MEGGDDGGSKQAESHPVENRQSASNVFCLRKSGKSSLLVVKFCWISVILFCFDVWKELC